MKPIYKRLLATLIDLLMVKVILDVLVQNGIFKTVVFETTILNKVIVFNYSNGWIILITYFFLFDIVNQGRTIGKMIFAISLKSGSGKISYGSLMLRSLYKLISLALLPFTVLLYLSKDQFIFYDHFSNITVCDGKKKHRNVI